MLRRFESRHQGINWLQECLGPATPRPVAEMTFDELLKDGTILRVSDDLLLMEDDEIDRERVKYRKVATRAIIRKAGNKATGKRMARFNSVQRVKGSDITNRDRDRVGGGAGDDGEAFTCADDWQDQTEHRNKHRRRHHHRDDACDDDQP